MYYRQRSSSNLHPNEGATRVIQEIRRVGRDRWNIQGVQNRHATLHHHNRGKFWHWPTYMLHVFARRDDNQHQDQSSNIRRCISSKRKNKPLQI